MRYPIAAAALLASVALVQRPAAADDMNVSVRSNHDVRSCDDLDITFDDRPAIRGVDQLTAPGTQKLSVQSQQNGGVYVFGEARTDFAISACKAVSASRGASALDKVRATVDGGRLSATGPGSDGWIVYFIVHAPTKADLDLNANNGPIHVAHVNSSLRS